MSVFSLLHPTLQEQLLTGLGWDDLRPVQVETYLSVSSGADTLILAPTAGGKTESAFFPGYRRDFKKSFGPSVGHLYLSSQSTHQ